MVKTLGLLILVLAIASLSAFGYFGGFASVTVLEGKVGPYTLIYERNKGSYFQTGKSVEKLMKLAKRHEVTTKLGFGRYYDDPEKVSEAELRSDAGLIVTELELLKLEPHIDGYLRAAYPETRALVADFPLKGFLSVLLGIWKVYPKMSDALAAKGQSESYTFEIYDIEKQRTTYAFPLAP